MLIHSRTDRAVSAPPRRSEFRRIFRERLRELEFAREMNTPAVASAQEKVAPVSGAAAFTLDYGDSLAWLAFRDCLRPARAGKDVVPTALAPQEAVEEVAGVWGRSPRSHKAARAPRTIDCESLREG